MVVLSDVALDAHPCSVSCCCRQERACAFQDRLGICQILKFFDLFASTVNEDMLVASHFFCFFQARCQRRPFLFERAVTLKMIIPPYLFSVSFSFLSQKLILSSSISNLVSRKVASFPSSNFSGSALWIFG